MKQGTGWVVTYTVSINLMNQLIIFSLVALQLLICGVPLAFYWVL
jgi:hypothetical protein